MNATPFVKKPKMELEAEEDEEQEMEGVEEEQNRKEQEEALLALLQHRTKEVEHLRQRITYYKSQVDLLSFLILRFSKNVNFFSPFNFLAFS